MTTEQSQPFELGLYTLGNTPRLNDGRYGSTAQAIRDALEGVHLAEAVGLDFFSFGENHTRSMLISSPTSLINAATESTRKIKIGATLSVLSTDEPIRVFQLLSSAAALAPGRIKMVAGRGLSTITFPIFDLAKRGADRLFYSKLELLLELSRQERVSWQDPHRPRPLHDTLIVPCSPSSPCVYRKQKLERIFLIINPSYVLLTDSPTYRNFWLKFLATS